jgi:hypothetical protein
MSHIQTIIYHGPEADLALPTLILKTENIWWQTKVDMIQMMRLAKGRVSPHCGWYVWFPAFHEGASTWTGIYDILSKRGLLLC